MRIYLHHGCGILLSLSITLRALNEEKLEIISNILFLLSFFIAIYNFTNLQKITSNKYKKNIRILYAFNITLSKIISSVIVLLKIVLSNIAPVKLAFFKHKYR